MSGRAYITRDSISSIVTLLIGLFVFVNIPDQIAISDGDEISSFSARTVPYLIASAIILLSLFMSATAIINAYRENADPSENISLRETTSYFRVFLAFSAIALWVLVLPHAGYNITTIFLVGSIMIIIGNCRWWQIVLLSAILSFPINYLLAAVLRVYLPHSNIF